MAYRTQHEREDLLAKILNFKVKTVKGELVRLGEIGTLSFGILTNERFIAETNELFITCKQGNLKFNLEDICGISFNLDNKDFCLHIESDFREKGKEKNEKINELLSIFDNE